MAGDGIKGLRMAGDGEGIRTPTKKSGQIGEPKNSESTKKKIITWKNNCLAQV